MAKLEKRLTTWKQAKLISEQQEQAILAFESNKSSSNWFLTGVVGLGVFAIAVGILALVAANWQNITPETKLSSFFSLWIAIGLGTIYADYRQRPLIREGCLLFFSLAMFAGIGLIAQIYNLAGYPWRPLIFWSFAMSPLVLAARSRPLPVIWTIITLTGLWMLLADDKFFKYGHEILRGVGIGCILSFLFLSFPFDFGKVISAELKSVWKSFSFFGLTIFLPIFLNILYKGRHHQITFGVAIGLLIGLLGAGLYLWKNRPGKYWKGELAILAACTLAILPICLRDSISHNDFIGFIAFLLPVIAAAYYAIHTQKIILFRLFSAIISIRIIVGYFEVFYDLATTGIGFIFSGVLILAFVFIWHKFISTNITNKRT